MFDKLELSEGVSVKLHFPVIGSSCEPNNIQTVSITAGFGFHPVPRHIKLATFQTLLQIVLVVLRLALRFSGHVALFSV